MSKPTAARVHAKRLARKRKPPRQRADTSGWPIYVPPAAVMPLLITMSTATSYAPPKPQPTIRATSLSTGT